MKVYFDVSCLNRPFDDQMQSRIRLEAEAVTIILGRIERQKWELIATQIAEIEVAANPDPHRRLRVQSLLPDRRNMIELSASVIRRGEELETLGMSAADALHVASAEAASADVMLTCDDRLLRLARRHTRNLKFEWLARSNGSRRSKMHRSINDIRRAGLAALRKSLGREGMIRFLQQFDSGHGDYVADRREWTARMTMADLKKLAARPRRRVTKKRGR